MSGPLLCFSNKALLVKRFYSSLSPYFLGLWSVLALMAVSVFTLGTTRNERDASMCRGLIDFWPTQHGGLIG
jgi:hypothetical protein